MDDLFNILSSSARLDKSKRKQQMPMVQQKGSASRHVMKEIKKAGAAATHHQDDENDASSQSGNSDDDDDVQQSNKDERKKRAKKQHSAQKLAQIHQEEINAFRRRMGIRLSSDNKHEIEAIPDPISSFKEWKCPQWWRSNHYKGGKSNNNNHFEQLHQTILNNIELGRWMEPTPIQMQSIPSLMDRRDVMGCAPTGSGKSGAFVLPALMISKCPEDVYYNQLQRGEGEQPNMNGGNQKGKQQKNHSKKNAENLQGNVRTVLLAPSRELSSQLHREVQRLSTNMPFKFHSALLSKSNTGLAISNQLGGRSGLDCLVATPLRLVECLERGMKLLGLRLIVLDEADRLLDASDGMVALRKNKGNESNSGEESETDEEAQQVAQSGSSQTRSFLQQIDSILSHLPNTATRALFSATLGPNVRHLSESILRSPIDITTGIHAGTGGNSAAGGASEHIKQELKFVGREEGKLLAIRQLVAEGITPPVLIFLQSKERAQALFGELLYDGIRVDVIHAGRSPSARAASVAKFRKGETWVLICTDLVARGVDFKAVNLVINYDLPTDGVTYVHRIGRTGRAGRAGRAITFFTQADFDGLRTIANIMKLSGCDIPEWMLAIKRQSHPGGLGTREGGGGKERKRKNAIPPYRTSIDTTPSFDKKKRQRKKQFIENAKKKKSKNAQTK